MRGAGRPELEVHFSRLLAPGEPLWCVAYGIDRKKGWDTFVDVTSQVLESTAMLPHDVDEGWAFGLTPQRLLVARARRRQPMLSMALELEVSGHEVVLASALRGANIEIERHGPDVTTLRGRLGAADVDVAFRALPAFPDAASLGAELARRIELALG